MRRSRWKHFIRDDSGATAIEYALIAGMVSVSILASLRIISGSVQGSYNSIASAVQTDAP